MVAPVVANSLRHGTRVGLLSIAGGQLGLVLMIGGLVVGLASILAVLGWCFAWLRLAPRRFFSCTRQLSTIVCESFAIAEI